MMPPFSINRAKSLLPLRVTELGESLTLPVTPPSRTVLLGWILRPLLIGLALTGWVWMSDFDQRSQFWIYERGGQSWKLGDHPFWKWIYHYGVFPALSVAIGSVVLLALGQVFRKLHAWRLICLFWVLSTALGPGLITNGILKEYWGRPRPREVEGLGGQRNFEPVLTYDNESGGKSFPSGHATMGFCLMGGYLLLYRQQKKLAWIFLLGGGGGGIVLGLARMAQGGHFFSDVMWAAIVCWWSSVAVFYGLGLHRKPLLESALEPIAKRSWRVRIGIGLAAGALIAATLLGTPYREKRDYFLNDPEADEKPLVLKLTFMLGDIELVPAEKLRIVGEAYGHGVPTSGIKASFVARTDQGQAVVSYRERRSGWLAEAKQQLKIEIPWERITRIELETGAADLWISLPEAMEGKLIELRSGQGRVEVNGEMEGGELRRGPGFLGELEMQK